MSAMTVAQATEAIYKSINADNEDIDALIDALKAAMTAEKLAQATFEPARLLQNNRQGRKTMESYFRKRGVAVVFKG